MPLLFTALVGGLLVFCASAGPTVLGLLAGGLVLLLVGGLMGPSDLPDRVLAGALVAAGGVAAVAVVSTADSTVVGAESALAPVLWVLGPAVVLVLFAGLARRNGRVRPLEWLALAGTGVVLAAMIAGVAALGRVVQTGPSLVVVTAAAAIVGVAVAVPVVPRRRWLSWLAAAVAVGVGVVALAMVELEGLDLAARAIVGAGVGVAGTIGAAAANGIASAQGAGWPARSALVATTSIALGAPIAAVLARVVLA